MKLIKNFNDWINERDKNFEKKLSALEKEAADKRKKALELEKEVLSLIHI